MGRKNLTEQVRTLEAEVNFLRNKANNLQQQNARFAEGQKQINRQVDGIMCAVALKYGEEKKDDETGETIGYRCALPMENVFGGLVDYEIRAERDSENNEYVIGAVKKIKKGDA